MKGRRLPRNPNLPELARANEPKPAERREKQTLIPSFDPAQLARDVEATGGLPTIPPPFDPASYARIVDQHVRDATDARDTPRTLSAATPSSEIDGPAIASSDVETIGRAMYGSYLESDFPEALVLAEQVLEKQPDHALAHVVAERCRALLSAAAPARLSPSSVVRLRSGPDELMGLVLDLKSELVLGHIDGVSDADRIAELSGIPPHEALDRLHALLDLGVVEVLSA